MIRAAMRSVILSENGSFADVTKLFPAKTEMFLSETARVEYNEIAWKVLGKGA